MYELLKRDGLAKRGRFTTVHGVVETPVFMNVGTAAAIKARFHNGSAGDQDTGGAVEHVPSSCAAGR